MDEELEQALRRIRGEPEDDMDSALRAIRAGSVSRRAASPRRPSLPKSAVLLETLGVV